MPRTATVSAAILLAAGLALAACSKNVGIGSSDDGAEGEGPELEAAFTRFPDLPLPADADIDLDRTLVFGGNVTWFGRLGLNTPHSANAMFDFFKQKLPEFGWYEITSVRASTSVLTYSRGSRVATIQILANRIRGSEVTITISPKGSPQDRTAGAAPGAVPGIVPGAVPATAPRAVSPLLPAPVQKAP